ncbi:YbhB/YbcL family Raf kinase inhibitor-like protein [Aquincola tertiaricarbonis]|uniref:YbhB/YbcL family Raf kinase inhibitor-like protein n=1 Tax=Aquincola tertiaricarbonis TaxID=391953 RepID=UPI000615289A|nr:YbhB/YbcL family Raf kinase inhibitor-like protein [Aquincola tertiaricarbonis]
MVKSSRPAPGACRLAAIAAAACLLPLAAGAQQGDGTNVPVTGHVYKPDKAPATPQRIASLKVPPGFSVTPFAQGLGNPRILAVAPDGTVYASRREEGDVVMMKDTDGDGRADGTPQVVLNRAGAHGLAIRDGKLWLVTVKELFVADLQPDGRPGPLKMLLGDLPDSGQHPNRTMAFGPDGMLYLSVGSTCNACNESNPENATLLRVSPDGKSRTIFASGLRNTIGFDWHPATGELWGMDHGIDYLGDDVQQEELNRIERGQQYGWPHVWGEGGLNPQSTPVGGISKPQWKAMSRPMTLGYTAHAAPMQMLFYTGSAFPAEYRNDAFVALRGSWNRKPASGYEIVRIRFAQGGQPQRIEPFVSGFVNEDDATHFARPVGLAMARDGALLMADDANGVIYRIAYTGIAGRPAPAAAATPAQPVQAPAQAMQAQVAQGNNVPLALARPQAQASGRIEVRSGSIPAGGDIPLRHSEYADGVSPSLAWTAVPGARSYAVIVEDPDASPIKPFVHWVAWNIPASVTHLPEGLQEQPRLKDPEGLLQGKTTRGSTGWYGPRPPVGDPPHAYHFQVLALDTVLDLPPGSDRDAVLAAAQGHVLARGELVGRYAQQQQPLK